MNEFVILDLVLGDWGVAGHEGALTGVQAGEGEHVHVEGEVQLQEPDPDRRLHPAVLNHILQNGFVIRFLKDCNDGVVFFLGY